MHYLKFKNNALLGLQNRDGHMRQAQGQRCGQGWLYHFALEGHQVPALKMTGRYSKLTKKEGCCVLTLSPVMPRKA